MKPSWIVTARHVVSGQPLARPIQLSFPDMIRATSIAPLEHVMQERRHA